MANIIYVQTTEDSGDYSFEYVEDVDNAIDTEAEESEDSYDLEDESDDYSDDYATTNDYEETTYDYELEEPAALEEETEEEVLEDLDNIAVDSTVTLELGEPTVRKRYLIFDAPLFSRPPQPRRPRRRLRRAGGRCL